MALFAIDLDHEEWLALVSDLELVGGIEVVSDGELVALVIQESLSDWGLVEDDIHDNVGLLHAPVAND